MKKYINHLFALLLSAVLVTGCEKDEKKISLTSVSAPVLTNTTLATTRLVPADSAKTAITFNWTNPNYTFTTGVSSQDVTYYLQLDTVGANFSAPATLAISKDLSITMTTKVFNSLFSLRNLLEDVPHNVEIRIMAALTNNSLPQYSNIIKMTITPYLDVAVPIPVNSDLWITGNAVASGYMNPLVAPYVTSQKFTKVSTTLYELNASMVGGGGYKLLQINSDWSTQYHMLANGTWDGGSFEKKDADPAFIGPPTAGTYKISMNFKTGKYTVTKQ